jgi:stage II sporulation protein AA (anti-sigma F factor antagonist)
MQTGERQVNINIRDSRLSSDVKVVELSGKLTAEVVPDLEGALSSASDAQQPQVVLNFSGVSHISSAILRVLLNTLKQFRERSGKLVLCNLNPHVEQVLKLAGFDQFFIICPDEKAAVEDMPNL